MAMAQSTTEVRFPPFPAGPPPGVTIIPFTDWNEIGILRETCDEIERDSLGIPTVPMPSAHATDVPKTNARQGAMPKSRKGKKSAAAAPGKEWHEEWVGQENYLQPGGYAPILVTERLYAASEDFVRSRNWPKEHEANSPLSIRNQYDQLRIFIGLIASQQDQNQKKKKQIDAADDFVEDDEDELSDEGAPANDQDEDAPHSSGAMAEKLWAFCDDPEERITVFLSQMMFTKGWIYSDRFLFSIPRLVRFFLIFLLKNKVLESEAKVKRALKIAEIAVEELPLISKIAKVFPDALNAAFLNCFGIRPDVFFPEGDEFATSPPPPAPLPEETKQEDDVEMKAASTWGDGGGWSVSSTEGNGWDTSAGDGWAASGSGWDTSKDIGGWEDETPAEWLMPVPKCLMTFLGATALPLTHTTGIVEQSTRRITKIIPPPTTLPPKSAVSSKPSADAVEAELEQRFTRVVFSPWDGETPVIHKLSKGAVLEEGEGGPLSSAGNLKPHNPWKDDVTVLVEHDTAKVLSLGMGIGGWFVQIARQDDFEVEKPKKKSKRGELRFWYLAGLTLTLTSYHVMEDKGV